MSPGPNPELRRQVIAIYKRKSSHLLSSSTQLEDQVAIIPTETHCTYTSINLTELLYLGRNYPQGYDYFRQRLHRAFMAKAGLTDEEEIKQGIARAEFVRKGTVPTLWSVRRRDIFRDTWNAAPKATAADSIRPNPAEIEAL
jgi:hypothetical protein